jgi:hypothetical protein
MTMLEVRKAYFGIVASDDKAVVRAYRLNNDRNLNRVFYQTVVAMSEKSYERRLRSLLLKYGTPRPREFVDVADVLDEVRQSNCGIVYVWSRDLEQVRGLKVIRLLWQSE